MIRTDLALEARELYHENAGRVTEIDGVKATVNEYDSMTVTVVEVLNEQGEKAINKKVGKYVTIEVPEFRNFSGIYFEALTLRLKSELEKLLGKKYSNVLVAGLGNHRITPDSIGPKTVDSIIVTRHLHEYGKNCVGKLGKISAISPGVLGTTGIESADILKGVCTKINPDLVVLVDALASRKASRVATTVQLSTDGLAPGSGIGNMRKEINKDFLGCDVVSIGVPMVINTETIAYDLLLSMGNKTEIEDIKKFLNHNDSFIVAPKEADVLAGEMSKVISSAINLVFHDIELDEIDGYIS